MNNASTLLMTLAALTWPMTGLAGEDHGGHSAHGDHAGHDDHADHAGHDDHAAQADHAEQDDHSGHDEHAAHRAMMNDKKAFAKSEARYPTPEATLIDQHGKKTTLKDALSGDDPIMLNFVFTTCTTICPVLSATFKDAQKRVGDKAHFISISIDPEHDSPSELAAYAKRFRVDPGWHFFTGSLEDIVAVQRAFDIYRGDKMNHPPVSFLRIGKKDPWLRYDGFVSGEQLASDLETLTAK